MAKQSNQTNAHDSMYPQTGGEGDIRGTKRTKATEKGPRRPTPQLKSLSSGPPIESPGFIPPHGGYQKLLSYQKALVVYDATLHFCDRFIDKTFPHPRPDGAGRPFRQTEHPRRQRGLRHLQGNRNQAHQRRPRQPGGTARRLPRLPARPRTSRSGHPTTATPGASRQLNRTPGANYETFKKGIEHPDPAICANVIVGLIKVTNYLLDQQLRRLEQDFLKEGGLRERMTRARLAARAKQR